MTTMSPKHDLSSPSDLAEEGVGNLPVYSVSDLAFALKRTLETTYGHVRLKGEISKLTRHASGHIYLTLKDDKAALDGVIWKGSLRSVAAQIDIGLEVIVTGRMTTYPMRSGYQIVIESLEAAGIGALLAQLERLKQKLGDEGLFAATRKKLLPKMPEVIGVITSPTGAVLHDILHRLSERWPVRVLVWPVLVQGNDAARQVSEAILGFNSLPENGPVPRPDILIVARGGGSVEDLWPFNDEALVRVVADSEIPLISAIGHETDTTLIDYASDCRAPTPTAAAEIASPVLAELRDNLDLWGSGLRRHLRQKIQTLSMSLNLASSGLGRSDRLLALKSQECDFLSLRLSTSLSLDIDRKMEIFSRTGLRLSERPLLRLWEQAENHSHQLWQRLTSSLYLQAAFRQGAKDLGDLCNRLSFAVTRKIVSDQKGLDQLEALRLSYNPDGPLTKGFVRIEGSEGQLVTKASDCYAGSLVSLIFSDGKARARILETGINGLQKDGNTEMITSKNLKLKSTPKRDDRQPDLF